MWLFPLSPDWVSERGPNWSSGPLGIPGLRPERYGAMERYFYLDIQRDLRIRTSLTFGRSRGGDRTALQAVGLGVVGSRPPRGPLGGRATSGYLKKKIQ